MIVLETLFVILAGCAFHFVYNWAGKRGWVKWFAASNESVFEHIKITIMPMIMAMVVDYWLVGGCANYFLGKFLSLLVVLVLMPTLFYLFKKILGGAVLWADISCFVLIVIWAELLFNTMLCLPAQGLEILGGIGVALIGVATVVLSYFPPKWGIFIPSKGHNHEHHEIHEAKRGRGRKK